jgi:predicted  nucleic acid-binding Zn-ribbon protein
MSPELERLIQLQRLETDIDTARQTIAALPARRDAVSASLELAISTAASEKSRQAENQAARRNLERDVAVAAGRLSKYRDQLMQVKTNKEYTAMQHEITAAETQVKSLEDQLLERMVEADEMAAAVKKADGDLVNARQASVTEIARLETEASMLEGRISELTGDRDALTATIDSRTLGLFNTVRARRGLVVVEARDGHCTVCQVRIRPQVFNEIRKNDSIIQCDSCQRILYFVASPAPARAAAPPPL